MNSKTQLVIDLLEKHLLQVEALLRPQCKLTLLARLPGEDESDILLTKDDLQEVLAAIGRAIARESEVTQ